MKKHSVLFTLLICLLIQASPAHGSKKIEAHVQKKAGIAAVACTLLMLGGMHWEQLPTLSLPANPADSLNTMSSVDHACFGFSEKQNGGSFVSDVYGPRFVNEEQNEQYMREALDDIKKEHPTATIHWYDCRYFKRLPYEKK